MANTLLKRWWIYRIKNPSWTPIKDAHGMVLLDDFASVQNIINASSEFAEVLKNTASTDPSKVITTPLTVGYFDGKDGLKQDARLLKWSAI
jgi:primary-amine oxidase